MLLTGVVSLLVHLVFGHVCLLVQDSSAEYGAELVLDMYGVCQPQQDVTNTLESALVHKAQQATLVCIAQHAHRNNGKITAADLNWILSQGIVQQRGACVRDSMCRNCMRCGCGCGCGCLYTRS